MRSLDLPMGTKKIIPSHSIFFSGFGPSGGSVFCFVLFSHCNGGFHVSKDFFVMALFCRYKEWDKWYVNYAECHIEKRGL